MVWNDLSEKKLLLFYDLAKFIYCAVFSVLNNVFLILQMSGINVMEQINILDYTLLKGCDEMEAVLGSIVLYACIWENRLS